MESNDDLRLKAFVLAEKAGVKNAVACEMIDGHIAITTIVDGHLSFDVIAMGRGGENVSDIASAIGRIADAGWDVLMGFGEPDRRVFDLADALRIGRVMLAPGALAATAMPPFAEASKSVVELGDQLDDSRLPAEFGYLSGLTSDRIPTHQSRRTEAFADVRVAGHSEVLTVPVTSPTLENIYASFTAMHQRCKGERLPAGPLEILKLHVRRTAAGVLPAFQAAEGMENHLSPAGWSPTRDSLGILTLTRLG